MPPPGENVVIFASGRFSLECPVENGVSYDLPLGDDIAAYLTEQIGIRYPNVECGTPCREDWGSVLDVVVDGQPFLLYINWVPLKDGCEDTWAIQFAARRGCIGSLFGQRRPAHQLCPEIMALVREVIANDPATFRDVRWLSEREFASIY